MPAWTKGRLCRRLGGTAAHIPRRGHTQGGTDSPSRACEDRTGESPRIPPAVQTHSRTNPEDARTHTDPRPQARAAPPPRRAPPPPAAGHARGHTLTWGRGAAGAGASAALPVLARRPQRRLFIRLSAARSMPGAGARRGQGGREGGRESGPGGRGACTRVSPAGKPEQGRRPAPCTPRWLSLQGFLPSCLPCPVPTSLQGKWDRVPYDSWGN